MSAADSAVKKAKVDQVKTEAGFESYPQDQYVISETLKQSRFEVLYMATRARAEVIRLLFEFCGVRFFFCSSISRVFSISGLLVMLTQVLTLRLASVG